MIFWSIPRTFQFTTSQGGRPLFNQLYRYAEAFQFTTSQGGRPGNRSQIVISKSFQFTTSQGGRPEDDGWDDEEEDFQFTTSQGGRQILAILTERLPKLSIHDLTRRSTADCIFCARQSNTFNSRPHKEVDRSDNTVVSFTTSFNSRPHKEVDREIGCETAHMFLSIHDLTRRSTVASK